MEMLTSKIEEWVLEYSCVHSVHMVIGEIRLRSQNWQDLSEKFREHIFLSTLLEIVHTRDEGHYEVAVEILDHLFHNVNLISSRQHARISYCLKILIMMDKVRRDRRDVVPQLNKLFPKSSESGENQLKLQNVVSFRRLVLQLLVHKEMRKTYFENNFEQDYGEEFKRALARQTSNIVTKAYQRLPVPAIDQIILAGKKSVIYQNLTSSTSVIMRYLVDMLYSAPGPDDFMELVNMLYPQKDIPHVNPMEFFDSCPQSSEGGLSVNEEGPQRDIGSSQDSFVTCASPRQKARVPGVNKEPKSKKRKVSDPLFSEDEHGSFISNSEEESDDNGTQCLPRFDTYLHR